MILPPPSGALLLVGLLLVQTNYASFWCRPTTLVVASFWCRPTKLLLVQTNYALEFAD